MNEESESERPCNGDGTVLCLDKLAFGYDQEEFEFSLNVNKGDIVALIGPSGAGKSTLLHLVAGLQSPRSGALTIENQSILSLAPYQRPISMLFQQHNLFSHLTVEQNIGLGISQNLKLSKQQQNQVESIAKEVGLADKLKQLPGELSGGQQQRVALARCCAQQKSLWLLDEPFSALDPALREEMLSLVERLARTRQITVLMVTHQLSDARRIAGHFAFIDNGKVAYQGHVSELEVGSTQAPKSFIGFIKPIAR